VRSLCVLVLLTAPATAEPLHPSVRIGGSFGSCQELTWTAPAVELVVAQNFGGGFGHVALGYSPVDNHTFLADGQIIRLAVAAGVTRHRLRVAAVLDIESIGFHADPDVLAKHPDVDVLARRGGFVPAAGVEAAYAVTSAVSFGVAARVALRELELFDSPSGDRDRARLVLGGLFLDVRLR
jgi:hypothetical protein